MSESAYTEVLNDPNAQTRIGFGKHEGDTYAWILKFDRNYARWMHQEYVRCRGATVGDEFAKAAAWFGNALEKMDRVPAARRAACVAKAEAAAEAARRAERERELERAAAARALHALRTSSARGQLATMPSDLLLHILAQSALCEALRLPCVCRDLLRSLGPLEASTPRMRLVIDHVFARLRDTIGTIPGGWTQFRVHGKPLSDDCVIGNGGFAPNDDCVKVAAWHNFKCLASKTLIDVRYTTLGVVRGNPDEFRALAMRTAAQRDAFFALRSSALLALRALRVAKDDAQRKVQLCALTGRFSNRQNNPGSIGQVVDVLKQMQMQYGILAGQVAEMKRLNAEHALCLRIPTMGYTSEKGEKELERFLSA